MWTAYIAAGDLWGLTDQDESISNVPNIHEVSDFALYLTNTCRESEDNIISNNIIIIGPNAVMET